MRRVRFSIMLLIACVLLLDRQSSTPGSVPRPVTPSASPTIAAAQSAASLEQFGRLPLRFEPAAEGNSFEARGLGYGLRVAAGESLLTLGGPLPAGAGIDGAAPSPATTVRLRLAGASPAALATGAEPLPGRANYFIGNDQALWRTNVPTYARVHQQGVYPGIDLVHYGNQKQLEYDFIVAPGADPRLIALDFDGAEEVTLDADGDLVLRLPNGELRQHKPVIYQEIDGDRRAIDGGYTLDGRQARFRLGNYDPTRPLVIDPVLVYSTYLGGAAREFGYGIAVDATGNIYVGGVTSSLNFPTVAPIRPGLGGPFDAFVAKLNPAGTALLYATYLGGSGDDQAYGLALDGAGSVYLTGRTASSDFPTAAPFQSTFGGAPFDAFVAKLAPSGSALTFATYLGGNSGDVGRGIAVDSAGSAYVTGQTGSLDFPRVIAPQSIYAGGVFDVFITKFSPSGTTLIYSTYLGGNGDDQSPNVAVDTSGNAYIAGGTTSTNFPMVNAIQPSFGGAPSVPTAAGQGDAFVAKLNPAGSTFVYVTYLGGVGGEFGVGIATDPDGNAFVTGPTTSTNFPLLNPLQPTFGGGTQAGDVFLTKLNPSGSALVFSTFIGGTSDDGGQSVAVDAAGNSYLAGQTCSDDFPITAPVQATFGGSQCDAYAALVNAAGTSLVYSTYLGGAATESAIDLAIDPSGNAYITGRTLSTNFPTRNAFQPTFGGGTDDAFIAKLSAVIPTLPSGRRLYVTNFNTDTVSIIDPTTNRTIGTIPAGRSPSEVAVHPDGSRVYVANCACTTGPVPPGSVSVINTATNTVVATIPVGPSPDSIEIDRTGARLFVPTSGDDSVAIISTATNTVTGTIPLPAGSAPLAAAINPAGTRLYVTVEAPSRLLVVDVTSTTFPVVASVPFASPVGDVVAHPDGSRV